MPLAKKVMRLIFSALLGSGVYRLLAKALRVTAETGRGSEICLKEGFLPVPVHFYSSLPDLDDLKERSVWDIVNELPGIDFRTEEQSALLQLLGKRFGSECRWPFDCTSDDTEFYLNNSSFGFGCAASTHCMIRWHRPDTVIEIGSGMSSRVIATSLAANGRDGYPGRHVMVDPYPGDAVRAYASADGATLIESRVELLQSDFFSRLKAGDILFIDSSHSVKIGGDVNYLYLNIMPRLNSGVVVHIHDISLPYEYSRTYTTSESFRQFWTEQYLLQAFLAFNTQYDVLLGMHHLMVNHAPLFKAAFPYYQPDLHPYISGSFWMQRRIAP